MLRIFRQEAIEHASRRLSGDVILAAPLSLRLLSFVLLICIFAAGLFASLATYSRKQSLEGTLVPPGGVVRIVARNGGLVRSLDVRVGDMVQEGQVLARLSLSRTTNAGDAGETSLANLQAERSAAEATGSTNRLMLARERERLENDEATIIQEIVEAERRAALTRERIALARAELDRARAIAERGFLPQREVELRHAAVIGAEADLSAARSGLIGLRRQLGQAREAIAQLEQRINLLVSETARTLAGLDQRRNEIGSQNSYVVTAPRSGRIAALPARAGLELSAGTAVAILASGGIDEQLVAELLIPSSASAFLRPGQPVRIGIDAFPYERFGKIAGRLREISAVPLQPEDLKLDGVTAEEPLYRAVVTIPVQTVEAYGRRYHLQPGMSLTADVETDRRSLIEWLFDPLYAAMRR